MLKDLFDKGKCTLGFHSGEWRYVRELSCQQRRICSRCKTESQQLVHDWQAWRYVANGACERTRQCGRCREQENTIEHSWGSPVYENEGACTQVRPCSRCHEKTAAGTMHVWDHWSYDTEGQCSQTAACSRCGQTRKETRIAHAWGDWYASKFYAAPVRVCHRCGEMIVDLGDSKTEKDYVSLQMVHRAVHEVMSSTNSDSVRERIRLHSAVLLSPVAEKYFNFAVDQLAADDDAKDTFHKFATLIDRCRTEGIDKIFQPSGAEAAYDTAAPSTSTATGSHPHASEARDQRLVGHWRSTEILGSGGFSYTIDTHCILDAGGRFQWYSRSSSGANGPEQGAWSSSQQSLTLQFDDNTQHTFTYVIEGRTLFCPQESRYRLWERIS